MGFLVNSFIHFTDPCPIAFSDDYSSTTGWTQRTTNAANSGTGSQTVGVDSGAAYANSTGSALGQYMTKDLGFTISNTNWTADFTYFNVEAINLFPFFLTAGTGSLWNGSFDIIGVAENNPNMLRIEARDGSGSAQRSSSSNTMYTDTAYYCRLDRDGTALTLKIYEDEDKTTQFGSTLTLTISGTVSGLTTLQHSGRDDGGATSGYFFKILKTEIYNNCNHPAD